MPGLIYALSSLLVSLLLIYILKSWVKRGTRHSSYPPGPRGHFILGNMFDFPTSNPWEVYCDWGKQYKSDIVYGSVLGSHVVVLNNRKDADELFEKRSHVYSGRPSMPVADLMGWNFNIGMMDYGPLWRYHRKICQQTFRPEAAAFYYPIQTRKIHELLGNLLVDPEQFEAHSKMLSISIPMAMMYGYDVESFEDKFIEVAEKGQNLGFPLLVPGTTLLNFIPVLCRLPPLAGTPKLAARVRQLTEEMISLPMQYAKNAMAEGVAKPSLVTTFLEKKACGSTSEEEERAIERIAATVYGAASDTTIAATVSFFFAMATNPDVQRKAQKELDAAIGSERLPDYNDRESLPYLEAIYREVLRWRPPGPLGMPHRTTEDDVYKGYLIPKGTTIFSNIWAMTHDESEYPEPFKFNPDRYFSQDGKLNDDDRVLAYGFGRRICVGRHVASSMVWLMMASVLATFTIAKAKDESGNEIEINDDYTADGLISQKKPFKCSITPRSAEARQLVEAAMKAGQ